MEYGDYKKGSPSMAASYGGSPPPSDYGGPSGNYNRERGAPDYGGPSGNYNRERGAPPPPSDYGGPSGSYNKGGAPPPPSDYGGPSSNNRGSAGPPAPPGDYGGSSSSFSRGGGMKQRKEFFDGDYEGELRGDKKHGKGIMFYKNKTMYEGDWENDQRQGMGVFSWPDGSKYQGQFIGGSMGGESHGSFFTKEGKECEATWVSAPANAAPGRGYQ